MPSNGSKDLKKVKQYIANLKKWLRKENQWQRSVRTEVHRVRRRVGLPGPPAPLQPPPKPPFTP